MGIYAPGSTSQSVQIQVVDDTGLPVTGLVAATLPAIYYWIAGAHAAVAISLSDLSTITTAYSSGGVKEIDSVNLAGFYRLDVPDAALASAGKVKIGGEASGKHVLCDTLDVGYVQVDVQELGGTPQTAADIGALATEINADVDEIITSVAAIPTNPYTGTPPTTSQIATAVYTTQMTESYSVNGVAPTLAQCLFLVMQRLTDFSIASTTITAKKIDHSTTAYTLTLDSATSPTSSTRAT